MCQAALPPEDALSLSELERPFRLALAKAPGGQVAHAVAELRAKYGGRLSPSDTAALGPGHWVGMARGWSIWVGSATVPAWGVGWPVA